MAKRFRIPRSKVRPRPEQVFEDTRTKRERARHEKEAKAIRDELDAELEAVEAAIREFYD